MKRIQVFRRDGLTLVEVVAVLAIVSILTGLLIPAFTRPRTRSNRIACVNNLKNIGLEMRIFANDHGGQFPMDLPASRGGTRELTGDVNRIWEQFLVFTNAWASPRFLCCPKDVQRKVATTFVSGTFLGWGVTFRGNQNLSYFLSLNVSEELPQTILSGDRNLTNEFGGLSPGRHILADGVQLGFDGEMHGGAGNILLGDGSVQQLTSGRLREQFHAALTNAGITTNVWLVP
ncbi:MAG: type II secretion system protein [Verrucomicrobiota bacterium]